MCYHLITYIEYGCAHQYPTRRHYIDCNGGNCRRSKYHKPIPHDCANECDDIMLPDQSIVMNVVREPCHICLGIDPSSTGDSVRGRQINSGHSGSESEAETTDRGSE
ncbi:hypothetical protein SCP_0900120 [Sparassis crispa]|uniref:Uncharacterized protein n=1 Tax=Sparassis crispa TaxID=139825 RepID=A0A401GV85_9APHY|nr:hypothetical protein SCP_0900120 [Sparassis crispa]GBE86135.1 hypothetical protein SCP_0900120 [Sparassis crispa]